MVVKLSEEIICKCVLNKFYKFPDTLKAHHVPKKFANWTRDVTKTGNGERGTGNGERGTGNGSLGTSVQR